MRRIAKNAAVLLAFTASATAQFVPSQNSPFAAGQSPVAIAVADFNGDSHLDLAIADQSGNAVMLLFGDGTGNFASASNPPTVPITFPQNTILTAIVSWDFNKDGAPDLAIAYTNANKGYVAIYLGDPLKKGNFKMAGIPMAVGKSPDSLATGDFNGDGFADIAVTDIDSNNVTIFLGNAATNGSFSIASKSPFATGNKPSSVAVGDFNGDGFQDLAIGNELDNTVTVMLGDGSGNFNLAHTSPVQAGPAPGFVVTGDFNMDGNLDLAVANLTGNAVTVLLGNGSGGFTHSPSSPISTGMTPASIVLADFNGDYILDLAIVNESGNSVSVLLGDGGGGFKGAANSPFSVGSMPRSVAIGDFNEDGRPDLATANWNEADATILINSYLTTPSMMSAASYMPSVAPGSLAIVIGTGLAPIPPSEPPSATFPVSVTITDASGVKTVTPFPIMLWAGPTQINLQIPQNVATGMASFTVSNSAVPALSQKGSVMIAGVAPGLFTASQAGKGVAAAYLIQNVLSVQPAIPIFSCPTLKTCVPVPVDVSGGNSALVLYGTGIRNRSSLSAVTVTINGIPLQPYYAGPAGDDNLEDQVNVSIPASLAHSGVVYLTVGIGTAMSNQVTLYLL
jgi:uncharacterized protein (TIGR03437 family)